MNKDRDIYEVAQKSRFANDDGEYSTKKGIVYDIPTDGLFQVKWDTGNLRYRWYYKNGKQDGQSKAFYYNGKLKSECHYKNGKLQGKTILYHENGKKEGEGIYKDDKLDGLLIRYYDNGQKYSEEFYIHGELISEKYWTDDGSKNGESNLYHQSHLRWKWKKTSPENTGIWKKGNLKSGKRDGFWRFWYINGQKKEEGNYKDNERIGTWFKWDKEGNRI